MESPFHQWRSSSTSFESLSIVALVVFDVVAVVGEAGYDLPIVQPALSFLLTGVVLGGLFLRVVGVDPVFRARWFAYAQGAGMIVLLVAALLLNAVLPPLGYATPISAPPLLVTLNVLVVGFAASSVRRREGPTGPLRPGSVLSWTDLRPSVLLFLTVPLVTILAVFYLNVTHDAVPVVAVLLSLAVLPMYVVVFGIEDRYHTLATFSIGLAILMHKSLWLGQNYGGHASVVGIFKRGVWSFGGESLAVNAVLMPSLGHLSGVPMLTYIRVIMPVIVAFIPLCLYVTFRSYADADTAFLGASLFMFAHPFYYQYPNTPRASMPVLFLALLATLVSDDTYGRFQRHLLAVLFAFGIITSHYGTSYYVMFALLGALVAIWTYGKFDALIARIARSRPSLLERFRSPSLSADSLSRRIALITRGFVGYYVTAVLAYYYFVDDGKVYTILVENVVNAYLSLFVETSDGGGATATRLTTDYGGASIAYSKYLYVLIALAVAVGLAVVHWDRLAPWRETRFDDDYLALSALLLALFGGTIVIAGQWGGGRPMMIVLSLNAVFAVIGMTWIARSLHRIGSRIVDRVDVEPASVDARLAGRAAFAVLLATFFALNTGTMAAVAYGGQAPSEVPNTDLDGRSDASNLAVHVFFTDHRDVDEQIFGDRGTRQRATDWRNGEIAAYTERSPYRFKPKSDLGAINNSDVERGYVVLLAHNLHEGIVDVDFVTNKPFERYELSLEHRHRVYSNDRGAVYYTDETAQRIAQDADGGETP